MFPTARAATSLDPNRFRRRDFVPLTRGVRLARSAAFDPLARIRGFGLVLGGARFLSHTTAAFVWGMPLPRGFEALDAPVHVTTMGAAALMRRSTVVAHRIDPTRASVVVVRGLRVSDPVLTWYSCRSLLSPTELVVLGDHIVGRARLATVDDLRRACRAGDRAVSIARVAASRVRVGAESAMETRVRLIVIDADFPDPELNVDVRDEHGRFLGRADIAWPRLRIAIEYDGDHHRTDIDTFHHDRLRGNGFAVNDWIVIHSTSADVRDPAAMLARLQDAFTRRAAEVAREGAR